MPNYAFRPRQMSNMRPRQLSAGWGPLQHSIMEIEPQDAFSQWLQWLNPSTAQRQVLQGQFSDLYRQYGANELAGIQGIGGVPGPAQSFFDYLSRINPERQYLSSSPYSRGTETRRFRNPSTRWSAFG